MNQNYRDLVEISRIINQKLGQKGGKIQRILSGPACLDFQVRIPGESLHLYLGRGSGFCGLWPVQKSIPSAYRIQDKFLELMRKELKNARLWRVDVDKSERILSFEVGQKKERKVANFFMKQNQLFFTIESEKFLFKSWTGQRQKKEEGRGFLLASSFNEVGREEKDRESMVQEQEYELKIPSIEKLWGKELIKKESPSKRRKFLKRKQHNIESDLIKTSKWKRLWSRAETADVPQVQAPKAIIEGIKIPLKGDESEGRLIDLVYQKAKNLKKGEQIQRRRLLAVTNELDQLQVQSSLSEESKGNELEFSKIARPEWMTHNQRSQQAQEDSHFQVEYYQLGAKKLAIGRDARSNDYIRKTFGKKDDMWMHIEGVRSCHLIIKTDNLLTLPDLELRSLASLLADKSQFDGQEIPIIYAPLKSVKGAKGVAGKVILKKPKYLTLIYEPQWPEILARL